MKNNGIQTSFLPHRIRYICQDCEYTLIASRSEKPRLTREAKNHEKTTGHTMGFELEGI